MHKFIASTFSFIISVVALLVILFVCYAVFVTEIVNLMIGLGIIGGMCLFLGVVSIQIVVMDELTEIRKILSSGNSEINPKSQKIEPDA